MTPVSPELQPLKEAFAALEPAPERLEPLEERILADVATDRKSLAGEWLELFRMGPILHAGYAVAAAAGLAIITPVGTLLMVALFL